MPGPTSAPPPKPASAPPGPVPTDVRLVVVPAGDSPGRADRIAADLTGLSPADPRHAYTYRVALTLGRLNPPDARSL